MTTINICSVVDCSSESKKYLSTNLLNDAGSVWKCDRWQDNCWVVLEINQDQIIDSIEITNSCSAFVEVFVSNILNQGDKVLISIFSLMSPDESKNKIDYKRKFIFNSKHFSSFTQNQPWKYIKFICSQPFNKTIKYGLSSIHVTGHKVENKDFTKSSLYGRFTLKEAPSLTNNFFAAYDLKYKKDLIKMYEEKSKLDRKSTKEEENDLNGKGAKADKENEGADEDGGSGLKRKKKEVASVVSTLADEGNTVTCSSSLALQQPSTSRAVAEPTRKRKCDGKKKKRDKPFDQLMSHVVFVLSGYENPLRSEIRDKATAMGARYLAKWGSNCTHLICAFANTPKYNEVRRLNGRIVTQNWILHSYSHRRLLEWRNYMMGTYRGPDTPDHSEQSDNEENADVANGTKGLGEGPTNSANGYDSDVIYDLDTEPDD